LLAKRFGEVFSPIVIGICLVSIGFSIAAWRTHSLEVPVLGRRYYGAIEGRVVGMDRSALDAMRFNPDQVRLDSVYHHVHRKRYAFRYIRKRRKVSNLCRECA